MIATSAARDPSVAAAYEQLRSSALGGSTTSGGHLGLVLLMREGIAAWMARRSARETPEARVVDPKPRPAPLAIDEFHAGIVRVLASMALAAREEMIA